MNERSYNSIHAEIESAIFEYIEENNLDPTSNIDVDNARSEVTDNYYIIGYYQCDEWLKKHGLTPWQAIEFVQTWHIDNCGKEVLYPNSEIIANEIAYIISFDVLTKEIA